MTTAHQWLIDRTDYCSNYSPAIGDHLNTTTAPQPNEYTGIQRHRRMLDERRIDGLVVEKLDDPLLATNNLSRIRPVKIVTGQCMAHFLDKKSRLLNTGPINHLTGSIWLTIRQISFRAKF